MRRDMQTSGSLCRFALLALLSLVALQLVSAELSGSVGSAPAAQQTFKKLGFVQHLLSVSHASRGPLPPALQELQIDAPLVTRLRGGRRAMRDEEEEEEEELSDDEDEEADDEEQVSASSSAHASSSASSSHASGSESVSESEVDDIDLDPLEEDQHSEADERMPLLRRTASSRDELPLTAPERLRTGVMTTSSRGALQLAEQRDKAEPAAPALLSLRAREHVEGVNKELQAMRASGALTDVHVVCKGGAKLPAHRAILAAASTQLRAMIEQQVHAAAAAETAAPDKTPTKTRGSKGASAGAGAAEVVLEDVEEACAVVLLDFIYTGCTTVEEDRLPALLGVSEKLGVVGLRDACSQHLHKELKPANALHMRALGLSLGAHDLYEAAHHLVMEEFLEVAQSNSFLELDEHTLLDLISSDDLLVNSEKEVLDAVVRWTEARDAERGPQALMRLMAAVRLGLLPLETLAKKVAACPAVQRHLGANGEWQAMLNRAIAYVGTSADKRAGMQNAQTQERLGSKGRFLVCVGGRKGSSPHAQRRAWMLDRIKYEWFEVDPLSKARKQVAAAEAAGKVYVAGGWDGSKYLRSVEMYDTTHSCWVKAASMAFARGSFGLGGLDNGDLLAVGGFDGHTHLASAELFSASSNNWTAMPPLAVARSGVRVAVVGGKVLAIGGFDGASVLRTVEEWDAAAGVWRERAGMMHPRRDHAVCVLAGCVYVAGGFNGTADLASVEVYDAVTDKWRHVADMRRCRSGLALAVINRKVHALGGYDGAKYLAASEAYDPKSNEWTIAPEAALPKRLAHFGLALL